MLIGERLRGLRESKNLSQGDIEKRTGLLRCYTEVGALRRRTGDASVRKIFGDAIRKQTFVIRRASAP